MKNNLQTTNDQLGVSTNGGTLLALVGCRCANSVTEDIGIELDRILVTGGTNTVPTIINRFDKMSLSGAILITLVLGAIFLFFRKPVHREDQARRIIRQYFDS